jgi:hypothetical protein
MLDMHIIAGFTVILISGVFVVWFANQLTKTQKH